MRWSWWGGRPNELSARARGAPADRAPAPHRHCEFKRGTAAVDTGKNVRSADAARCPHRLRVALDLPKYRMTATVTTPSTRDTSLDVMRLIGLLMIILAHVDPPEWLRQLRNFGTPLLIVASAATYAVIYDRRAIDVPSFYQKRLTRLVIQLWSFLSIFFGSMVVVAALSARSFPCTARQVFETFTFGKGIGYVSDAPALYDWMRVSEIGWFASSFYSDGFLDRYQQLIMQYELPQQRKIRHLSKGQRAKVALALALGHDPELLILDEPTCGLDPLVRREFLESMVDRAAAGRTVLLSSHQISEVERVADDVAILHAGKFRLIDSLAALKESVSEVTITMADSLTAVPQVDRPAEVLSEQIQGRQRQWVVRGFTELHREELERATGVLGVRVVPATLDEMFVACTRGQGAQSPNNSPVTENTRNRQAS